MNKCEFCNKSYKTLHKSQKCEYLKILKNFDIITKENEKLKKTNTILTIQNQVYYNLISKVLNIDKDNKTLYNFDNELHIVDINDEIDITNICTINLYSNNNSLFNNIKFSNETQTIKNTNNILKEDDKENDIYDSSLKEDDKENKENYVNDNILKEDDDETEYEETDDYYNETSSDDDDKSIINDIPNNVLNDIFNEIFGEDNHIDYSLKKIKISNSKLTINHNKKINEMNINELYDKINKLYKKIETSNDINLKIIQIKECNNELFKHIKNVDKYTKWINETYKKLEYILMLKNIDSKRMQELLNSSLSPLDTRLLVIKNHNIIELSVHDIFKYKQILKNNSTEWIVFNYEKFSKYVLGYNCAIKHITEMIEDSISKDYPNIIYRLDSNLNINHEDPYGFYILDKIELGKKYWKLDCRLYNLSCLLGNDLLSEMISIFRSSYNIVFNDNIYRENFIDNEHCKYLKYELQQMFDNILLVTHNEIIFAKILMDVIKDKFSYKPNINDIFDFYYDDMNVSNIFKDNEKNNIPVKTNLLKKLFDNITLKQITNFKYDPNNSF
jgi:hypothetical protein